MKKFKTLIIMNCEEKLCFLIAQTQSSSHLPFSYMKTASVDYAKNIFLDLDHVACYKTQRKSLFEATVWMVITNGKLVVTNITSESNSNLGVQNYNNILSTFFQDFLSKFIDESYEVTISGDYVEMSQLLKKDTFEKLHLWESTCDKLSPLSHFLDRAKWLDFLVVQHDNNEDLAPDDLTKWLIEDCSWSTPSLVESAENMGISYEFGKDLLNHYKMYHEEEE